MLHLHWRLFWFALAWWARPSRKKFKDTPPSFSHRRPSTCYVRVEESVCKAAASYHEYVTEHPPACAAPTSLSCLPTHGPLACHVQRTFFRPCSKGGTDPSERKTVEEIERPGGTRLDRALCIRYLAIILGGSQSTGEEKRVSLSVHSTRPIKRAKHAGPLGTLHAAHVGRGEGGKLGSLLKLKKTHEPRPAGICGPSLPRL